MTTYAEQVREYRKWRAARLRYDPTLTVHGRESTYVNWLCRCDKCRAAHAAAARERNRARRARAIGGDR